MTIIEYSGEYWLVEDSGPVDGPFRTPKEAGDRQKELETPTEHKLIVACLNANGEPDFYFCKVRCTGEQYNSAEHYVLAEDKAIEAGYEPRLAFDEKDAGGKAILKHFVWKSASTFTV